DLAALVRLTDRTDEDAPGVGVGFSPGESAIDQPYFYVSPWPYPPHNELPAAPAGSRWHMEGWVGLYLTAGELAASPDPADQERRARAFLAEALAASTALVQPGSRLAAGRPD